ncbi:MAG: hypothetical protein J0M08_04550 [Bacteroidetes bacterium]|nr:hypothetical protein [Bacteroidota bacterium]
MEFRKLYIILIVCLIGCTSIDSKIENKQDEKLSYNSFPEELFKMITTYDTLELKKICKKDGWDPVEFSYMLQELKQLKTDNAEYLKCEYSKDPIMEQFELLKIYYKEEDRNYLISATCNMDTAGRQIIRLQIRNLDKG